MDDNWISGISYCGYHDSAPAVIPTVANLSVYIVTWGFVSRIDYKLPAGGYAFRVYLACPGGTQFGQEGGGPLEVRALGRRAPSGTDKVLFNAPLAHSINCRHALKAVPLF